MLQKKKGCSCNDNCFEKSERLFQDKMNTWNTCNCQNSCKDDGWDDGCEDIDNYSYPCKPDNPCDDYPLPTPVIPDDCPAPHPPLPVDPCHNQVLAMAYVKNQSLNTKALKNYQDALRAGTLFEDLDLPFLGGKYDD